MVQYATPTELAGFMQQDLDTYSATQALTLASSTFSSAADTWFTSLTTTYSTTGTRATTIVLPFNPVTAVSAVRINGSTVTGYSLIGQRLYRSAGFGFYAPTTPDLLEVDLTYGYSTVPDDVKLAVLEIAAGLYEHPSAAVAETIDDYSVRYDPRGRSMSGQSWRELAAAYRGTLIA